MFLYEMRLSNQAIKRNAAKARGMAAKVAALSLTQNAAISGKQFPANNFR
jgi:hypothetical protein